jgi:hypothetical protein
MRRVGRLIGIIFLVIAGLLGLLALITWDPGELFFALPYFFLLPALLFGIVGLLLFLATRKQRGATPVETRDRKDSKSGS